MEIIIAQATPTHTDIFPLYPSREFPRGEDCTALFVNIANAHTIPVAAYLYVDAPFNDEHSAAIASTPAAFWYNVSVPVGLPFDRELFIPIGPETTLFCRAGVKDVLTFTVCGRRMAGAH